MLKEVGASGQISLGKKFAGQLFDMQTAPNGTLILTPVKVVPMAQEQAPAYPASAPGAASAQWARENEAQIAQYNTWATQREPYSRRVRRWRESQK